MEVVLATGVKRRAKPQSNHHRQSNIQFLRIVGYPSYGPTNSVKALKETSLTEEWLCKSGLLNRNRK